MRGQSTSRLETMSYGAVPEVVIAERPRRPRAASARVGAALVLAAVVGAPRARRARAARARAPARPRPAPARARAAAAARASSSSSDDDDGRDPRVRATVTTDPRGA